MSYEAELIAEGLCPDLVWIDTEDGPVTGRCRGPLVTVTVDGHDVSFACEGHTAEYLYWRSLSEPERVWIERQEEAWW